MAAAIPASVSPSWTTYGSQPAGGRQVVGGGGSVTVCVAVAGSVVEPGAPVGAAVSDGAVVTGAGVRVGGIGWMRRRCSAIAVDRLAPMMRTTMRVIARPPAICRQPDTVRAPGCGTGFPKRSG